MFTQAMQYEIKDDAKGTEGKYYVQNKIYKFSVVLFLLFYYSFPSCHSVIVITTPKTPIITYFLRVLLSYDINFLIWHWLKHFE